LTSKEAKIELSQNTAFILKDFENLSNLAIEERYCDILAYYEKHPGKTIKENKRLTFEHYKNGVLQND
jgi:hypothetical protein